MGFDGRFTAGLVVRVAALGLALAALVLALLADGYAATRLVTAILVLGAAAWLWTHVRRTNRMLANFVEALHAGDTAMRFSVPDRKASFGALAAAFDGALARLRTERLEDADELRFLQALLDDVPVALLVVDGSGSVEQSNKAARRLFGKHDATRAGDYARYGATFARRLAGGAAAEETLLLHLDGRPQRAIVRTAQVSRLGVAVRAITVQPAQGAFDMVEMATQSDLVRVLTHEILNSLTPVTSLAATASMLIEDLDPDDAPALADARAAIATLARRAQGLTDFVQGYRAVAQPPEVKRRLFAARPWADELARLFAAEWPALPLASIVVPQDLAIEADPDLMAQVLINLLRNAAQAAGDHRPDPQVSLVITAGEGHGATIRVEDNGPGIPPDIHGEIFLPFFTTRRSGSGIGLNLARQIVVAHGGTIDVAPGDQGAVLEIRLP